MVYVIFKNDTIENMAIKLSEELGIKSKTSLEGKKRRIHVYDNSDLIKFNKAGIKYKIILNDKIKKHLTDRGLMYLEKLVINQ